MKTKTLKENGNTYKRLCTQGHSVNELCGFTLHVYLPLHESVEVVQFKFAHVSDTTFTVQRI